MNSYVLSLDNLTKGTSHNMTSNPWNQKAIRGSKYARIGFAAEALNQTSLTKGLTALPRPARFKEPILWQGKEVQERREGKERRYMVKNCTSLCQSSGSAPELK